jgi:hypothetical protein
MNGRPPVGAANARPSLKVAKIVKVVWLSAGVVALGFGGGILGKRLFERGALGSATLEASNAPASPRAAALPACAAPTQPSITARSGTARALEAAPAPTVTSAVAGEGALRVKDNPSPVARARAIVAKRESRPARASTAATRHELTLARPEPVSLAGNLRLEIDLIDAARETLRTGASARSLEILDQYSVRFPHGSLAPEGMALRVEALMRLGRTAEARAVARQFVAANPTSPLVAWMNPLASGATPP